MESTVNVMGRAPVTNAEFTKAFAAALRRLAILRPYWRDRCAPSCRYLDQITASAACRALASAMTVTHREV